MAPVFEAHCATVVPLKPWFATVTPANPAKRLATAAPQRPSVLLSPTSTASWVRRSVSWLSQRNSRSRPNSSRDGS